MMTDQTTGQKLIFAYIPNYLYTIIQEGDKIDFDQYYESGKLFDSELRVIPDNALNDVEIVEELSQYSELFYGSFKLIRIERKEADEKWAYYYAIRLGSKELLVKQVIANLASTITISLSAIFDDIMKLFDAIAVEAYNNTEDIYLIAVKAKKQLEGNIEIRGIRFEALKDKVKVPVDNILDYIKEAIKLHKEPVSGQVSSEIIKLIGW